MRELTRVSMMCSTGMGMVGDECLMSFLVGLQREGKSLIPGTPSSPARFLRVG
jgi:hypothetical protein